MMRIASPLALGARALHELAAPWPQHRCLFDRGGAADEVEEDGLVIVGYPHHDDPLSLLAQALGHRQRGRHAAAVLALGPGHLRIARIRVEADAGDADGDRAWRERLEDGLGRPPELCELPIADPSRPRYEICLPLGRRPEE